MVKLSPKVKLAGTLALIMLASVLASSLVNYNLSRESIRAELLNSSLPLTRDNIYSELFGKLMKPIMTASIMANDTFLRDWADDGEKNATQVVRYLGQIKKKYHFFSTFFVSAETGKYYYPEGVLKTMSPKNAHDRWYYHFIKSGEEYDLDVDTNQAAQEKLTIFVNFRLEDDQDKLLGVTGVGLRMDSVSRLLKETQKRFGRKVFFVDADGVVQAHPDTSLIQTGNLQDIPGIKEIANKILKPRKEPASFQYDRDDEHFLLTCRYIPEFKWSLIVEQDDTDALATARRNMARTIGIGILSAIAVIFITLGTVGKYQDRIEALANTDELTGAANRRALEKQFKLACYRAGRENAPFSVVLVDVDGLKRVNDKHGHLAGDGVIKAVADISTQSIRPTDFLARWGGDEFIILADCGIQEALAMSERIRKAVCKTDMAGPGAKPDDQRKTVSVSIGVSEYAEGDDMDSVILRADKALYKSKNDGRNKVKSAE